MPCNKSAMLTELLLLQLVFFRFDFAGCNVISAVFQLVVESYSVLWGVITSTNIFASDWQLFFGKKTAWLEQLQMETKIYSIRMRNLSVL